MADRIKQNQELRKALETARELALQHAKESENIDPMEVTYINLAAEVVDLRIGWLKTQAEIAKEAEKAAREAKKAAKAEPEPTPAP